MSYIVNAEYERVLFQDIVKPASEQEILKTRIARQYLFYYINQDPNASLVSYWDLSNETSDYLESIGLKLPKHTKDLSSGENWYGKLQNLELERKLNNKLSAYELLELNDDLPKNVSIVNSYAEIFNVLKNSSHPKWILKSPYSCGGQNIQILQKYEDIPPTLPFSHILEPYLERVLDLSLYFNPATNEKFFYITHIHQNCTYMGGRVYQDRSMLEQDLKKDGLYDVFMSVIQNLEKYLNQLKKYKLEQPLTLDSFIYKDKDGFKGYPLCETNYRISMGTVNHHLRRFLPDKGVGLLLALRAQKDKDWKSILPYSVERKSGIISMNEGNTQSAILFLCAPDLKTLYKFNQLVFNFEK